eukprot:scaffold25709_cov137-Skeletonema_menzelii.AAC.1
MSTTSWFLGKKANANGFGDSKMRNGISESQQSAPDKGIAPEVPLFQDSHLSDDQECDNVCDVFNDETLTETPHETPSPPAAAGRHHESDTLSFVLMC